jgi:hypothetical protein
MFIKYLKWVAVFGGVEQAASGLLRYIYICIVNTIVLCPGTISAVDTTIQVSAFFARFDFPELVAKKFAILMTK